LIQGLAMERDSVQTTVSNLRVSAAVRRLGHVGLMSVVALALELGLSCERSGESFVAGAASRVRSASPPVTIPAPVALSLPDPGRLSSKNCSGTPPKTAARTLRFYTMRVAPGWTDTTETYRESQLLELTAPATFGDAPTRIKFWAVPGEIHVRYGAQATAHSIAVQHAAHPEFKSPQSSTSPVNDCLIGGQSAAVFGYAQGGERGYRLSMVHNDFLYEIWLSGTGGISDAAMNDALGMMGSIVLAGQFT
jgi:hypothetical protein